MFLKFFKLTIIYKTTVDLTNVKGGTSIEFITLNFVYLKTNTFFRFPKTTYSRKDSLLYIYLFVNFITESKTMFLATLSFFLLLNLTSAGLFKFNIS